MNCGIRHFGNDVMQLSYCYASIYANVSFNFLKKVVRDKKWPTAPLFVVNISHAFEEFTTPLCHILPIHNVTLNSNNMFVNFRWTFTFCVEKSYDKRTSHFAGLSISTANSNTSHSNKAGSTTLRQAWLTGKGSNSTAVLP
jgi:hypothetical protein